MGLYARILLYSRSLMFCWLILKRELEVFSLIVLSDVWRERIYVLLSCLLISYTKTLGQLACLWKQGGTLKLLGTTVATNPGQVKPSGHWAWASFHALGGGVQGRRGQGNMNSWSPHLFIQVVPRPAGIHQGKVWPRSSWVHTPSTDSSTPVYVIIAETSNLHPSPPSLNTIWPPSL